MSDLTVEHGHDAEEQARRLARLRSTHARMRRETTVGGLLAFVAASACAECGFDRAVVLTIDDGALRAGDSDALADPASDRLRRLVLQEPITITPASLEAVLAAEPDGGAERDWTRPSVAAERLQLDELAMEIISLDGHPTALLVVDRPAPAVGAFDRVLLASFATTASVALEQIVLRVRLAEVASELRHLTAFTQALMHETLNAPLTLPDRRGGAVAFPLVDVVERPAPRRWEHLLTGQERKVAELLLVGRSNREIAEALVLSVDTVKSHVGRILRKLGVASRSQAVAVMTGAVGDAPDSR
jgi:DNA-binding CsgD family transcriptional regulator